jgi:ADP-dependent NAD(P)H-hydrate dehydratase
MAQPVRLDEAVLRAWPLPALDAACDKEARGRVLIVAGSGEIPGAARLAATAALRAGAGKVVVATAEPVAVALAVAMPELRVIGLPEAPGGGLAPQGAARLQAVAARADALLVGPGLQG